MYILYSTVVLCYVYYMYIVLQYYANNLLLKYNNLFEIFYIIGHNKSCPFIVYALHSMYYILYSVR